MDPEPLEMLDPDPYSDSLKMLNPDENPDLVLDDAHGVVEITGDFSLDADEGGAQEDLASQVQDERGPVLLCNKYNAAYRNNNKNI